MTAEHDERTYCQHLCYAQCWEDADVLLDALDIRPGHVCLSIASGGDNALAMRYEVQHPKHGQFVDAPVVAYAGQAMTVAYSVANLGTTVTALLADEQANIEEIRHERAFGAIGAQRVEVEIVVQTRGAGQVATLLARLAGAGFSARAG